MFALIGTACLHHAVMMAPQAVQLLQVLVSQFDNYASNSFKKGGASQNSIWAAGKLLVAFARLQLPIAADASVCAFIITHLLSMISKYAFTSNISTGLQYCFDGANRYATLGQTDRVVSLIWVNAITAVFRIASVNPVAVCACLSQSSDCARLFTCLSTAPLNPKLFPRATTEAAVIADDHDLAVCGRGCVSLLSRAATAPATLPGLQQVTFPSYQTYNDVHLTRPLQSLPNFLKLLEQWSTSADAQVPILNLQPQSPSNIHAGTAADRVGTGAAAACASNRLGMRRVGAAEC